LKKLGVFEWVDELQKEKRLLVAGSYSKKNLMDMAIGSSSRLVL